MIDQGDLNQVPLSVDEVMGCMQRRWGVVYDLKLIVRKKQIYFQIMWAYLEQQSFPLSEEEYKIHVNEVLEIINRLGQADFVRDWIENVMSKPRIGRALTLQLKTDERFAEFVL